MPEIKVLLADVDGTLVTQDKELTDEAIAATHRLHDAGIKLALTSGRPPKGMEMLLKPLKLETPIAAFNGGLVVDPEMKPLEQKTIPQELVAEIVEVMSARVDVWIYQNADWFITKKDGPHVAKETSTVQFEATVVESLDGITEDVEKITGVSDDHDLMATVLDEIQERFGDKVAASRSQPYYCDVTHPQANKGGVVKWLSEHYGIDPSEIATIGDMPNDVSMFKPAGLSIAMGQSEDEVKEAADKVTASNEDEGFAKAIDDFILGDK